MKYTILPKAYGIYASIWIILASLSGCAKDESHINSANNGLVLSATFPETDVDTKACLKDAGTTIYWEKSDAISVFAGDESAKFTSTNAEMQILADFAGELNIPADFDDYIYALYPYSNNASCTDGLITTTLSSKQTGEAGSFAIGTNIAAARSLSTYLSFHNLIGGMRFTVTRNDITEVVLEGNNNEVIAGKVVIGFDGSIPKVKEVLAGETSITLKAPGDGTFEVGKWYYITALPASFDQGFKLTMYNTENLHATYWSFSAVSLERSCFGSLKDVDSGMNFSTKDDLSAFLYRKWYLGYWVYGSMMIKFNGVESIDIQKDKLIWQGQMDSSGNGDYAFTFDNETNSFTVSRSDYCSTYYIRELTEDILIFQEGEDGALRYWYTSVEDAENASEPVISIPDPSHTETSDIDVIFSYQNGSTYSSQTPMGIYYEGCHVTNDEDREWLKDPSKEPDYLYANENQSSPTLTLWKHFDVTLYPYGDPLPADVNQHSIGDCSFCSVMTSFAYLYPDYIKHIITDNEDGTYTVGMYDPQGKPVDVTVNSRFLCESSGTIAQVTGKDYVPTWSTILEKALMKWETLYKVSSLWGIGTEIASPVLTGDGRSFAFSPNSLWNSEWKLAVEWVLSHGMISIGGFTTNGLQCGTLTSVSAHAFAFMLTSDTSGTYLFSMRNPWGITEVDGILEIPNAREVVSTIDMRYVYPGAAEPYLKKNIGPYNPPKFTPYSAESSVSSVILKKCGYIK